MADTKIEWTERVYNPIVGCSRVSPGCQHCYAERMAKRLVAMGQEKYQGTIDKNGRWTGNLNFDIDNYDAPLRRKQPTVYFVDSMSDLFHESIGFNWLMRVWNVMRDTPQHTYQILTKRAEVMERTGKALAEIYGVLPNVWLGVSVESQEYADRRIPHLLRTPAAVRFLSCEPLLGPVDLVKSIFKPGVWDKIHPDHNYMLAPSLYGSGLHWIIVGGESGPGARPMHPDWARRIRDDCQAAGVPFFFKQWGEWLSVDEAGGRQICRVDPDGRWYTNRRHLAHNAILRDKGWQLMARIGKRQAGRLLDGVEWSEFPTP